MRSNPCVVVRIGLVVILFLSFATATVDAQETYRLSAPGLNLSSTARIDSDELMIEDAQGKTTVYRRLPRYDTADQRWIAYSSREAQQVLLWPANNSGHLQIGTLRDGSIRFTVSKMSIVGGSNPINSSFDPPLDSGDVLPDLPSINTPGLSSANPLPSNLVPESAMTPMQLFAGQDNQRLFLSGVGTDRVGLLQQANNVRSAWYVVPVVDDLVRLQQQTPSGWNALGVSDAILMQPATNGASSLPRGGSNGLSGIPPNGSFGGGAIPRGGSFGGGGAFNSRLVGNGLFWPNQGTGNGLTQFPVSLSPLQYGSNQLWRLHSHHGNGGYCFESVLYPGLGLTCVPGNGLYLQPIVYNPWQIWWPQQPTFAVPTPQYRTISQQTIANPPLPASQARIVNTHTETLMVVLADRRNAGHPLKFRIPAGGSQNVTLDRDAGATIVETVETLDSFGNWVQREWKTPVPPAVLYDVSIYEEFLQSIAIDRTGKSPNPIEDVNYQPRSIGFFLIPPGDGMPENAEVDAYRIAKDAENPGAVRKLKPSDLPKPANAQPAKDPLKDLLNQFQKKRAAF